MSPRATRSPEVLSPEVVDPLPALSTIAAEINTEHGLVIESFRRGLQHARRAGALLTAAKEQLDHGAWLPWLREHCPDISIQVAQRYMRIHTRWSELEANTYDSTHLSVSDALALLARPKTETTETDAKIDPAPGWVPLSEITADSGWHYDNPDTVARLQESVQRYGQLRPIVVGTLPDGKLTVVDGRCLLAAIRAAGRSEVWVVDIGTLEDTGTVTDVMLALGCGLRTDYARLAYAVSARIDAGATPDELATRSPFSAERIQGFRDLATWSWDIYSKSPQQLTAGETNTIIISDPATGAIITSAPADDGYVPAPAASADDENYKCPSCAYEWSGKPRPWRAGGRAMADARDRRNGIARLRLVYEKEQHREIRAALRLLESRFGTTGAEATLLETVRRAVNGSTDSEHDGSANV